MAYEKLNEAPEKGFADASAKTEDIQNRLSEPDYNEEASAEIASPELNQNDDKAVAPKPDYKEESAAEIAAPGPISMGLGRDQDRGEAQAGTGVGWSALALSIISLFVLPVLFGAAGIIVGFIARRRGATGLGNWAIGIGAISIIVGMFILPFF